MNQTPNYQLSQWEADDKIQRADFNADNVKIDAVLAALASEKGNCQIAWGSYTGANEYGPSHPNTLTFPFPPKIVFIAEKSCSVASAMAMAIQGQSSFCHFSSTGGGAHCTCAWEGNTLTWYTSSNASWQLNIKSPYLYVALG